MSKQIISGGCEWNCPSNCIHNSYCCISPEDYKDYDPPLTRADILIPKFTAKWTAKLGLHVLCNKYEEGKK